MTKRFTAFLLFIVSVALGQNDPLATQLAQLSVATGKTPAENAVQIGKKLLGKPYVSHTLDHYADEQLVVNMNAFDCTTYLETVLAITLARTDTKPADTPTQVEQSFKKYLTQLRYRNGHIDGYASRLHYFSDWLRNNEKMGLLTDVTAQLPGSMSVAKPVSYMTSATHKYPAMSDPAVYRQMLLTETSLNQQSFSFIPTKYIRQAEGRIQEGDIVMLMAARPGLDMRHVGLAIRQPNGRLHLLHASSERGRVVISPLPLSNYVLSHKRMSGIRVARLRGNMTRPDYQP
ncbi:MAG: DUF1460 domain-containing protein [Spirosoma sp.]|nr:DUF1460 domain-containing protein [Spirosoma sp.]